MTAGVIVVPSLFPARDRNGRLVAGALMEVRVDLSPGLATVYADAGLTTPLANPVTANGSGVFPLVWAEAGTEEDPVLYTIAISGPGGVSIANPSVFSGWRPSVDAATAQAAIAQAGAVSAQNDAAQTAEDRAAIQALAASSPEAPSVANKLNRDGSDVSDATSFRENIGVDLGLRFTDPAFPGGFAAQAFSGLRLDTRPVTGQGSTGLQVLAVAGTLIPSTIANFSAVHAPDAVTVSGWVLRGAGATNTIVAGNFGAWWENAALGQIIWATEIDVNNESGSRPIDNDDGGIGIALNTGSTYIVDTGLFIRRLYGAGTGPGFRRGIKIAGARDVGIEIEAMSPATYGGISPAAPGTITAIKVQVSGDAQPRFLMNQAGTMAWGSGTAVPDVSISRGAASLNLTGSLNLLSGYALFNNGSQVVGARGAAIADVTPAAGAPTQAEFNALVTSYNTLLSRLRSTTGHGLIT